MCLMRQQTFLSPLHYRLLFFKLTSMKFSNIYLNVTIQVRWKSTYFNTFCYNDIMLVTQTIIMLYFFPPCQQKRVVQDVHPGCLMLLLDAGGGQEVFCMFLLYFQSLRTFVSASFCCGNCWVCSPQCWESMVGQALYRLVFFDFLFLLLGSFFGEFLSKWVFFGCICIKVNAPIRDHGCFSSAA